MNQHYGKLFEVQIAGESHGHGVGCIIQGCPAGLSLNESDIQIELDKRKPGQKLTTARTEADRIHIKTGVFNGKTTGAPILLWMDNTDTRSADYEALQATPRPGHADVTAAEKYGGFNDYRGSGPFSARLTAPLVATGAIARKLLQQHGVEILGHVQQLGGLKIENASDTAIRTNVANSPLRCADAKMEKRFEAALQDALKAGDSLGAVIECRVRGLPMGVGEPRAQSVESAIGAICLGIPAAKGVEFGEGFAAAAMKGSQHNDAFEKVGTGESNKDHVTIRTKTNHSGGTLGGITTGMPLIFRVVFKPTSSIAKTQTTLNVKTGKQSEMSVIGRHDPCVALRAVPIVEAAAALALVDLMLQAQKIQRVLK
ncbi:chorismate synthase [Candidatus Micrarchaeota archaeon]|nr:chorismate synthase [Candidatus Micrarchaeota archaeon]